RSPASRRRPPAGRAAPPVPVPDHRRGGARRRERDPRHPRDRAGRPVAAGVPRRRPAPAGSVSALDLTVRVGPIVLANPIVAASGTFGHGDEVARLCDPARLGAVTAKSQAAYPWEGNAAPRLR